jgi:peptide/nickel transport system substrate-binding protein
MQFATLRHPERTSLDFAAAARLVLAVSVLTVFFACAPASQPSAVSGTGNGPAARPEIQRTLVVAGGRSPESLAMKPVREAGGAGNPRTALRAFNAALVIHDERELPRPYLAESLPQLNSDSWRVSADGTMETTYRLLPNLTWHDGAPLTGQDFVFAARVYTTPEIGLGSSVPIRYLEQVMAPDDRTVVVRWRQPYAGAGALQGTELPPLPRHILERPFQEREADAFAALPYWVTEYVGAGPYRLSKAEPGAWMEGEAFAGHALGKPKIEQIRLLFMSDPNAVIAGILAGTAHVAANDSMDLEQALVLERQWSGNNGGVVLRSQVGVRHSNPQLRPEFANPQAMLDLRVRRAFAYSTDRVALAEALTEGSGNAADTFILPQVEYFDAVKRTITTYPFDARRAEQLMGEAGWTKGGDGFYTHPAAGRFTIEIAVAAGGRNDSEVAIMADGLRRVGYDATIRVIPRAQITDRQQRAALPGILNGSHNRAFIPPVQRLRASDIPTAENRWQGGNQAGWTHPEFERLVEAYDTALDRNQRNQYAVDMLKLVNDELPVLPLYYNLSFLAHTSNLSGPMVTISDDVANWNLPEWSWTR